MLTPTRPLLPAPGAESRTVDLPPEKAATELTLVLPLVRLPLQPARLTIAGLMLVQVSRPLRTNALPFQYCSCIGTAMAAIFSANLAGGLAVGGADLAWLFLFGAVNLGLGLALYVTGARLVPAAVATLVSTIEPVLAPVWVWLVHGEVPDVLKNAKMR